MGKKRGRKSFANYTRGNIRERDDLGTLAAASASTQTLGTVDRPTRISSVVMSWSLSGYTVVDNAGPIMVGIVHGDYTLVELEEWIELLESTSWKSGDKVAAEISGRLIRRVGYFEQVGQSLGVQTLNGGKPIKTKLNWKLVSGEDIKFWSYNAGSAALATTDPQVDVSGHANLWGD